MLACACLPACAYACVLPPRSVASCLCAFCSTKLDAKALVAAVCQHVDPTIACETFWQHQYKQQQPSKASAARVCVRSSIVVVVIYVIFQNFCLVCVTNTLAQHKAAARRCCRRRRLSAIATATLVWSGLLFKQSGHSPLCSLALSLYAFVCYVLCSPQLSFTVFAMRSCFLSDAAAVGGVGVMPSDFVISVVVA